MKREKYEFRRGIFNITENCCFGNSCSNDKKQTFIELQQILMKNHCDFFAFSTIIFLNVGPINNLYYRQSTRITFLGSHL